MRGWSTLFTDIVGSTERAVALGDAAWAELLERHHAAVRAEIARFGGDEMDTSGEGFFAIFPEPIEAVGAALAVVEAVRELGLTLRVGVHAGDCHVADGKCTGLAIHIGARITALAAPGEVLVSEPVRDQAASRYRFTARGLHELKGVPGTWRLFAAAPPRTVHGRPRRTLPPLGRRGGGWVAAQVVLIAAVFLSPLVGLTWPASLEIVAYVVGAFLMAAGASLLIAGGGGLARVSAVTPFPSPRAGGDLQTTGVYRLVRHPMYGGGVLIALGWSTIFATVVGLLLTVALAVFADLKARREEQWLEERFAGYADYRRRTRRRLIPFVW
ncbi:MAG: methyltransferase [Gaiellaceae bacterium]